MVYESRVLDGWTRRRAARSRRMRLSFRYFWVATRARILIKIAEGWNAAQVAAALDVAEGTVYRVKRRYADEGLDGCGVRTMSIARWHPQPLPDL